MLNQKTLEVLDSVENAVERQIKLWGAEFDDKNTANDWVAYICHYVAKGAYCGRKYGYSPEKFRKHLITTAAMFISAIAAIDRNKDCAPRHYEGLKNAGAKTQGEPDGIR